MCGRKLCEMGEEEATEAERRRKRDAELKRKKTHNDVGNNIVCALHKFDIWCISRHWKPENPAGNGRVTRSHWPTRPPDPQVQVKEKLKMQNTKHVCKNQQRGLPVPFVPKLSNICSLGPAWNVFEYYPLETDASK